MLDTLSDWHEKRHSYHEPSYCTTMWASALLLEWRSFLTTILLMFISAAHSSINCMWQEKLCSWYFPSFLGFHSFNFLLMGHTVSWFVSLNKSSCISESANPCHNKSCTMVSVCCRLLLLHGFYIAVYIYKHLPDLVI